MADGRVSALPAPSLWPCRGRGLARSTLIPNRQGQGAWWWWVLETWEGEVLRTWLEALRAWPLIFDPPWGLTEKALLGSMNPWGPVTLRWRVKTFHEAFPAQAGSTPQAAALGGGTPGTIHSVFWLKPNSHRIVWRPRAVCNFVAPCKALHPQLPCSHHTPDTHR